MAIQRQVTCAWSLEVARGAFAVWGIRVAGERLAEWSLKVARALAADWAMVLESQASSPWSIQIAHERPADWSIITTAGVVSPWVVEASKTLGTPWAGHVSARMNAPWSIHLSEPLTARHDLGEFANSDVTASWALETSRTLPAGWSMQVAGGLAASWTVETSRRLSGDWDIRAERQVTGEWSIATDRALRATHDLGQFAESGLITPWSVEVAGSIDAPWALAVSNTRTDSWSIRIGSSLTTPAALEVSGSLAASWPIQISARLGGEPSLLVSRQISGTFDYLPPVLTFDQPLPLTFDSSLAIAQVMTGDGVLPVAFSGRFIATVWTATFDQPLPLTLDARIQADARRLTADNPFPIGFEAAIAADAREMRGEGTLPISVDAAIAADARSLWITGELPIHVDAILAPDARDLLAEGELIIGLDADMRRVTRQLTADLALPIGVDSVLANGYKSFQVREIQLPLVLDAQAQADARSMAGNAIVTIEAAGHISFAPRSRQVATGYDILFPAQRDLDAGYAFGDFGERWLSAQWGLLVQRRFDATWDLGQFVQPRGLDAPWKIGLSAELRARYGAPLTRTITAPFHGSVSRTLEGRFAVMGPVHGDLAARWSGTEPTTAALNAAFDLMPMNPVEDSLTAWWDLLADQPPIHAGSGVRAIHFGLPI